MRSFLTRLINGVGRVVLLVPCLLSCLACATPFRFENLKHRMPAEAVREKFGAAKATEAAAGTAEFCWTYWHEDQDWLQTFFPFTLLSIPLAALAPGITWKAWYAPRSAVLLDFREEKLVRWEVVQSFYYIYEDMSDKSSVSVSVSFPDPPICSALRLGQRSYGIGEPPLLPEGTDYVTQNQVSLWSAPTTSSERRAFLDRDQRVKLLGRMDHLIGLIWRGEQWCHVVDDSDSDGWIRCEFLTASKP